MAKGGAVKVRPQIQLGEKMIDDPALERQLVERQQRAEALASYRQSFQEIDETVKGRIRDLRINGSVRCGGFVITVKTAAGRSVEFETKPAKRIRITPIRE